MSSTSQKYHVTGFKFFRTHKKKLITLQEKENLSAAAIGAFIFALEEVLPSGELPSNYKHIKISKEYNVKYSTYTTGFYECIKHNLICVDVVQGKKIYYINGYKEENRSKQERPNQEGDLSYFQIPGYILRSTNTIQTLIRTKNAKGLIEFIRMYDRCVTSLQYKKQTLTDYTQDYNFKTFKERVKWSAKKIREFLAIISPVLNVKTDVVQVKKPRIDKKNRIRKAAEQIVTSAFHVCVPQDIVSTKAADADAVALLKEATTRVSLMKLPTSTKDSKGLRKAINDNLISWKEFMEDWTFKRFSRSSIEYAFSQLEEYIRKPNCKVNSTPAYITTKLREGAEDFIMNFMDENERIDLATAYYEKYNRYPAYVKKAYGKA